MLTPALFPGTTVAPSDDRITQLLIQSTTIDRVTPLLKPEINPPIPMGLQNTALLVGVAGRSATESEAKSGESKDKGVFANSGINDGDYFRLYTEHHGSKASKNEPFPLKLYRIIYEAEQEDNEDIISFCPGGQSFMIHKTDDFVKKIMPKYFISNRITSFQRQLNLYGFRRLTRGEDKGGFIHDFFFKNQRNLCLTIKRKVQTFKVPPHLLKCPTPTPTATYKLAVGSPSPSDGMNMGQSASFKSFTFGGPPRITGHRLQDIPSSFQNPAALGAFPTLSSLMMSEDLLSCSRGPSTAPPLSSRTSELLKLSHQINLAKERAAMKQQVALAAIRRLVNRIDL